MGFLKGTKQTAQTVENKQGDDDMALTTGNAPDKSETTNSEGFKVPGVPDDPNPTEKLKSETTNSEGFKVPDDPNPTEKLKSEKVQKSKKKQSNASKFSIREVAKEVCALKDEMKELREHIVVFKRAIAFAITTIVASPDTLKSVREAFPDLFED